MKRFLVAIAFALLLIPLAACSQGGTDTNKSAAPAANTTAAGAAPDALTADPGHYEVMFENDAARLIRIKYPAGAKSVMHNHPAGCGIFLVDQKFKFTMASGEDQTVENHAGDVTCGDMENHLPQNAGDKDAELILLELKNRKTFDNVQTGRSITIPSKPNVSDAVTADPKHYSVQFENDAVRVVRIKTMPGEKTPMHAHPANCTITLTDDTDRDSSGKLTEIKAGTVDCSDALSHSGQNLATHPVEVILIEFKNREKFKA
jgi:quercetin dioxygenase-like cupin family protein